MHDFNITNEKMRSERLRFLESLPYGLQQYWDQALKSAISGDSGLLESVRNSRNNTYPLPKNVECCDVRPDMHLFRHIDAHRDKRLPLLIYLHGGGWVLGSINNCSRFCSSLASTGRVMVLAVNYALAPEHSFPQGLDDCVTAYLYAKENACVWGADPERISVGGDSSGGNLAIASALKLQRANVYPSSLLLFYPVVKAYNDHSGSWKLFGNGYGQDAALMETFIKAYLGNDIDCHDMYVSPADAADDVLDKLPDTFLVAAGKDILRDQGEDFCHRLAASGVKVERIEFPEACHLFITVPGQDTAFMKSVELASALLYDK